MPVTLGLSRPLILPASPGCDLKGPTDVVFSRTAVAAASPPWGKYPRCSEHAFCFNAATPTFVVSQDLSEKVEPPSIPEAHQFRLVDPESPRTAVQRSACVLD
jgi:hypothetical protein